MSRAPRYVGFAVGAQGAANLLAAFPAAWLADRYSRVAVIRFGVVLGFIGFAALVASVHLVGAEAPQFYCICAALGTIGLFMGSQSSAVGWPARYSSNPLGPAATPRRQIVPAAAPPRPLFRVAQVEAIFGNSVESGARSKLYVRKSSLKTLGNAAGPLLSIIVFAVVGDHFREGELRIVIAAGAALFVVPALLVLGLSEKRCLGALSESLLAPDAAADAGLAADAARRREVRIAATVCCADVVSMLGSGMTIKFFPLSPPASNSCSES